MAAEEAERGAVAEGVKAVAETAFAAEGAEGKVPTEKGGEAEVMATEVGVWATVGMAVAVLAGGEREEVAQEG